MGLGKNIWERRKERKELQEGEGAGMKKIYQDVRGKMDMERWEER